MQRFDVLLRKMLITTIPESLLQPIEKSLLAEA